MFVALLTNYNMRNTTKKSSYQSFNEHNPTNYVATPKETAAKLQSMLLSHINKPDVTILDPCAGDGILTDGLDYAVTSYDIEPRRSGIIQANFLDLPLVHYDCAVVNPPFNLKKQFIDKCLQQADYVALIAPYKWTLRFYSHYIIDCWHDFSSNCGFTSIGTTIALFILSSTKHDYKYVDPSLSDKYVLLTKRVNRESFDKYPDSAYAVVTSQGKPRIMKWSEVKATEWTACLAYISNDYWACLNVLIDSQKNKNEMTYMLECTHGRGVGWFVYQGIASYKYIPVRTFIDSYPDGEDFIASSCNKSYDPSSVGWRCYSEHDKGYAIKTTRSAWPGHCCPVVPYTKELLDYFNNDIDYEDDDVKFVTHLSCYLQIANLVFDPLKFRLEPAS